MFSSFLVSNLSLIKLVIVRDHLSSKVETTSSFIEYSYRPIMVLTFKMVTKKYVRTCRMKSVIGSVQGIRFVLSAGVANIGTMIAMKRLILEKCKYPFDQLTWFDKYFEKYIS